MMRRVVRISSAFAIALSLPSCTADPSPAQILRCRLDAGVTLGDGPKVRSLYLDRIYLFDLLRDRNLQFVEISRETLSGFKIDRLRLAPSGSPSCAPKFDNKPNNYPPLAYQFRTPRGTCLVIDKDQKVTADATLRERVVPNSDFPASIREAVRRDGVVLAKVVDYRENYLEIADVTCAKVIRGFPTDTFGLIVNHVTDPR